MGTRSAIGMRTLDGRITAVYCHWDGYPQHNGAILAEHYTDVDKIAELISLGDLSVLREQIGEKHDFNARYEGGDVREDWCVAYHRDRGEKLTVRVFNDAMDFVDNFRSGEEYFYLWNGTEWLVNAYARKSDNGFPVFDRMADLLETEAD
jgi:hypothetical protein